MRTALFVCVFLRIPQYKLRQYIRNGLFLDIGTENVVCIVHCVLTVNTNQGVRMFTISLDDEQVVICTLTWSRKFPKIRIINEQSNEMGLTQRHYMIPGFL